jgi:hypothetical protein
MFLQSSSLKVYFDRYADCSEQTLPTVTHMWQHVAIGELPFLTLRLCKGWTAHDS